MSFESLGLSPALVANARRAGWVNPTPIQSASVPVALTGRDLVGCAQTGTGKTAAFVMPTAHRLASMPGAVALVLAPTRELALQITDTVRALVGEQERVACILGGVGMEPQARALRASPRWIVATPGRLIDHMARGAARLGDVRVLVLDEADRMLDMGFAPQLRRILAALPTERQTLLFSATMPDPGDAGWRDVMKAGLRDPARVSVDPPRVAARAEQALWLVDQGAKTSLLLHLLQEETGSVLVFTRTKHRADRIARQLVQAGVSADRIHGDRSQGQRERALAAFRGGEARVLVATDIAARGLDVDGVAHVVNLDIPAAAEDYVHRVGRTARAQRQGRATTFVTPEETPELRAFERTLGQRLPEVIDRRPEFPPPAVVGPPPRATSSRGAPAPRPASPPAPRAQTPRPAPRTGFTSRGGAPVVASAGPRHAHPHARHS